MTYVVVDTDVASGILKGQLPDSRDLAEDAHDATHPAIAAACYR